jgi:uroporphyrinogen III methyltransferase/synthase
MVAAIGPATAQALAERGVKADFVPDKYVAEAVVEGLLALQIGGKKVLIPRAAKARDVLPDELRRAGAAVEVLPVYETHLAEGDPDEVVAAIEEGEIHFLTFTSSSTVDNFFKMVAPGRLAPLREKVKIACIGPITAATLGKHGFTPDIQPESYTIPALAEALVQCATAAMGVAGADHSAGGTTSES